MTTSGRTCCSRDVLLVLVMAYRATMACADISSSRSTFTMFVTFAAATLDISLSQTIVSIVDESVGSAQSWLDAGVSEAQTTTGLTLDHRVINTKPFTLDGDESQQQFCSLLSDGGIGAVVDVSAGSGWEEGRSLALSYGLPYVHAPLDIYYWLKASDDLLYSRNATDAALVFSNNNQLEQGLHFLVGGSVVRVIVLNGIQLNKTADQLKKMRPAPSYYVLFGESDQIDTEFRKAVSSNLVSRDSGWTLAALDFKSQNLKFDYVGNSLISLISPNERICCTALKESTNCDCSNLNILEELAKNYILSIARVLKESNIKNLKVQSGECTAQNIEDIEVNKEITLSDSQLNFYENLKQEVQSWEGLNYEENKYKIFPDWKFTIYNIRPKNNSRIEVGTWDLKQKKELQLNDDYKHTPIKRFFKVGTIQARPWMDIVGKDASGKDIYEGYCYELTKRLAEMRNFEYEFVFPKDEQYGGRMKNGTWNGLVGDLANGETDIIVAPLTMTSEREEVIDFVAPYFDQSGISIVIRRSKPEESLFKFMLVLRWEVWVSIVAALMVTGFMIWLLDRYSPYSAQNNAHAYTQPFRKFTLKESFWFALTSFTPQGGGEAPKALSGRILVAAYWLFVVLMLATFTANLAAFLTVERMQTPVSSLEELASQSKINYTVLDSASTGQYFNNMATAEEELYRVWKELTLNSTSDQSKYRVWDYPIKEQYTHILQVIKDSGPVTTAEEGFDKVKESENGGFAFIHDASEIRYEVYHNCLLTEVGEPFAEQPYAIAVQQGSHLQDEISRAILELQKDRYFETLSAQFWNSSARSSCPNADDSEGITLQSLGGVFIATLIGLALAMIALAVEVFIYNKKPSKTSSETVKPAKLSSKSATKEHRISRINVTPVY